MLPMRVADQSGGCRKGERREQAIALYLSAVRWVSFDLGRHTHEASTIAQVSLVSETVRLASLGNCDRQCQAIFDGLQMLGIFGNFICRLTITIQI